MLKARPYAELFITMFPTTSSRTCRVMLLLSLIRTQKLLPNTIIGKILKVAIKSKNVRTFIETLINELR